MHPPTVSKTAYHHGDLRAQLVAAVRELVELHGPEGFSIAQASRLAGVSTAAPYKHFKDKPEILLAVVSDGMDRLYRNMVDGVARYPLGSLDAISAAGLAYVTFAKTEPGVFRLMFGLTDGHEGKADLETKGRETFGVVIGATAAYLNQPASSVDVQERAYMLWCFVHGHSFLTIDGKRKDTPGRPDDWTYVTAVGRGILGAGGGTGAPIL